MLFLLTLVFPFILFVGGAYVLDYPMGLGVLYGINVALIYLVLLSVLNRVVKLHSQQMELTGDKLLLSRKQLSTSLPVISRCDLQVPVENISSIGISSARTGYFLTVRFVEEGKTMGVDLELNPLRIENKQLLDLILQSNPQISTDQETKDILHDYEKKVVSWKGSYLLSLIVLGLALILFFAISVFLGAQVD